MSPDYYSRGSSRRCQTAVGRLLRGAVSCSEEWLQRLRLSASLAVPVGAVRSCAKRIAGLRPARMLRDAL
jgi:hypothetical protein